MVFIITENDLVSLIKKANAEKKDLSEQEAFSDFWIDEVLDKIREDKCY